MYDPLLDIFISVVKEGSFSKAAQVLYLTHTAVIKQMNILEEKIGVQLFYRSHHGVSLTQAGELFYEKAIEMIQMSEKSLQEVKQVNQNTVLLLGTSSLYPSQKFMNLWEQIHHDHPEFQLKIVSIDNDAHRLDLLKTDFDFIVGPFNKQIQEDGYRFIPLGEYRFCLMVSKQHVLSSYEELSFQDLEHQDIRIMKEGHSPINDQIRRYIHQQYPHIHIIDIEPSYDFSTFNQCVESHDFLLSLECWKDIHPSLKTIKLKENFYLPYGLVTLSKPKDHMKKFLKLLEK